MAVSKPGGKKSDPIRKIEDRRRLRESRNFDSKAHVKQDAQRSRGRASAKTKQGYLERVKLYEEFLVEEGFEPDGFHIKEGHPVPTLEELKTFIRWFIASTKGRIDDNPTMKSVLIRAQEFVPGFYIKSGNRIPSHDTEELYHWIEHTLTSDGTIKNVKREKYNFTITDYVRIMTSFWIHDDPVFLHGRHKIQIPFIVKLYLFTGARIGAFCPASKDKMERGLRYKHIQLVLFRTSGNAPWKLGWKLDQQWVKNNRDPKYTVFSIALWDHDRPLFSAANDLLALAFLDNALFGYNSPEDLFQQRIPEGKDELPLRWKKEALDRCIVRNISGNVVSEDALTKERFNGLFEKIAKNAGYFVNPTVHAMRRALGKTIDEKHTSAKVAQVLTQRSDAVYGRDYVAHCSSISTVDEVLGEAPNTTHIEYFQSYSQFHEEGLPRKLPAAYEKEVECEAQLIQLRQRISDLSDADRIADLRREYNVAKSRLRAKALRRYQTEWVEKQRDWRIVTRGQLPSEHLDRTGCTRVLAKVMPELGRLAAVMSSNHQLGFDAKLTAIQDLCTHGGRDFDVVYRPGEHPVEGTCPAPGCQVKMVSLKMKGERRTHIHDCLQQSRPYACYCWECFELCDELEHHRHCQEHVKAMTCTPGIHYDTITYRHTLIKPAYCIFCLWNERLDAHTRLRPFTRTHDLRVAHLDRHIEEMAWPGQCPDKFCGQEFGDEASFRRHLHDMHAYSKSVWRAPVTEAHKAVKLKNHAVTKPHSTPASKRKCSGSATRASNAKKARFIEWKPSLAVTELATPTLISPDSNSDTREKPTQRDELPGSLTCHDTDFSSSPCAPPDCGTSVLVHAQSKNTVLPSTTRNLDPLPIDPRLLSETAAVEGMGSNAHVSVTVVQNRSQTPNDPTVPDHSSANDSSSNKRCSASQGPNCTETDDGIRIHAENLHYPPPTKTEDLAESPVASICRKIYNDTGVMITRTNGPLTRAKAKGQAAMDIDTKNRKARHWTRNAPLSAKESLLIKKMIKDGIPVEEGVRIFLQRYPERSKSSVQRLWASLDLSSQRVTRSRTRRQ